LQDSLQIVATSFTQVSSQLFAQHHESTVQILVTQLLVGASHPLANVPPVAHMLWLHEPLGSQATLAQTVRTAPTHALSQPVLQQNESAAQMSFTQVLQVGASLSPATHLSCAVVATQPLAGSQESTLQTLLSLQVGGVEPMHLALMSHLSTVVQALPSLQAAPSTALARHPSAASQLSVVQGFLSSHASFAVPAAHSPAAQTSPTVHALLSLHAAVLAVWVQPSLTSQASLVQTLPSSQLGAMDPAHLPVASHTSAVVQALPSSHSTLGAGRSQT
jgi:hypothetical protein